jgi:two-component system chemotaxis response regulator CheB
VVRRRGAAARMIDGPPAVDEARTNEIRVVVIGASTGGPIAIRELLLAVPAGHAAPILLVQHMPVGFVDSFVRWLREATGHAVRVASAGTRLAPGEIYVAPDGCHLGLDRAGRAALSEAAPEQGSRPSVSHLFRAAREAHGAETAAVLLSGMGKDGAAELLRLKRAGAVTFAQSRESAAVFGMPGEAVRLDAASFVLPPAQIGAALAALMRQRSSRARRRDMEDQP